LSTDLKICNFTYFYPVFIILLHMTGLPIGNYFQHYEDFWEFIQGGYLVTITGHTFHYIGSNHPHASLQSGICPLTVTNETSVEWDQCLCKPADTLHPFHPTTVGATIRYGDITLSSCYEEYFFWVVMPCSLEKFQRSILPPSSGSKSKKSNFHSACYLLHGGFLFGLFCNPEDWGDRFLWHVGRLWMDYMRLYPRR
jgi:hypothetical protein